MADHEIDPDIELNPAPQDNQPEAEDNENEVEAEASEDFQSDDDGQDDEEQSEPAPELIDWDLGDGKKVKVPAAVKDALMLKADYTRKTQEVAEQRKSLDAERESLTAFSKIPKQLQTDLGRLASVDDQLERFVMGQNGQMVSVSDIDWVTWQQRNPQEAQKALQRVQALQQQRASLQRAVEKGQKDFESETQQQAAKRLQATRAFAEKELPNWSPDREKQLADVVISKLSDRAKQILGDNIDPSILSILDAALDGYRYREATAKRKASSAQSSNVTPLKQVGTRAGAPATAKRDPAKMSMSEYVQWREGQGKKAG